MKTLFGSITGGENEIGVQNTVENFFLTLVTSGRGRLVKRPLGANFTILTKNALFRQKI